MVSKYMLLTSFILTILFGNVYINIPLFSLKESLLEEDKPITLEIPKISLVAELYAINDIRNNLNERLIFLNSSSMPDEEKGNVIIAGHSGYGEIAYFKKLHQLEIGDLILLTYQGEQYVYVVTNRYLVSKTGQVEVIRDSNQKSITLITCYGNYEQLIIVGQQKNNIE